MPILLLLNTLVILTASRIVYGALKIRGIVDSLLALFIVYLAQIILMELILGMTGALYLRNLVILALAVSGLSHLIIKVDKGTVLCGLNLKAYFDKLLSSKIYIFIFSVAASFLTVKVLINLLNPPAGWDSLNYHFTFPVEWLKHGNLNTPITVFDDPSPTYYPLNGSLFYLWLIFPLHSVFLADLGQLPFFAAAVLSVYGLARKTGLNRNLSFYAAALFMLVPNFFKQLQIAYVDVMVASLFLICVNYLFLMNRNFNLAHALVFSLSLGLFIGTKTVALPYSILLIIPFGVIFLRNPRKIGLLAVSILSVLALGGFSYLRNFIETANPLYPLDYSLFNMHIFKGVMLKASYASHFNAFDYSFNKMLFHEGLGLQGLLIMLPAAVLALPVTLCKEKRKTDFYLTYFLALPVLLYLAWRYVVPLVNLRYLYAAMGISIACGFYLLSALSFKKTLINALVIICVFASIAELAKRQELVSSLILSGVVFIVLISIRRIKISVKLKYVGMLFVLAIFGILAVAEKYYNANEYPRYRKMTKYSGFWPEATEAWDWLNDNTRADNIAYAGRPVPFPLYGCGFKNNVYYVSVNKTEPAKLHYFKGGNYDWGGSYEALHKNYQRQGNYRQDASFADWLNNLRKYRTDYLFIYSLHHTREIEFPLEDAWAAAHPETFNLVFKNKTVKIYKITAK